MRPMNHAEAHELLADLALEPPGRGSPEGTEDRERLDLHVEACETCRADLVAWRRTHQAIDDALMAPDGTRGRLADVVAEPATEPPASLRAAIAGIPGTGRDAMTPQPSTAPVPRMAALPRFGFASRRRASTPPGRRRASSRR
jgi:hypothetical protein